MRSSRFKNERKNHDELIEEDKSVFSYVNKLLNNKDYIEALNYLHEDNIKSKLKDGQTFNLSDLYLYKANIQEKINRHFEAIESLNKILELPQETFNLVNIYNKLIDLYCYIYDFNNALNIAELIPLNNLNIEKIDNNYNNMIEFVKSKIQREESYFDNFKKLFEYQIEKEFTKCMALSLLRNNNSMTNFEESAYYYSTVVKDLIMKKSKEYSSTDILSDTSYDPRFEEFKREQDLNIFQIALERNRYNNLINLFNENKDLINETPLKELNFDQLKYIDEKFIQTNWISFVDEKAFSFLKEFYKNCVFTNFSRLKRFEKSFSMKSNDNLEFKQYDTVIHASYNIIWNNKILLEFQNSATFYNHFNESHFESQLYLIHNNEKILIWYDLPYSKIDTFEKQNKMVKILNDYLDKYYSSLSPYAEFIYSIFTALPKEKIFLTCVVPGYNISVSIEKLIDETYYVLNAKGKFWSRVLSKDEFKNMRKRSYSSYKIHSLVNISPNNISTQYLSWDKLCFKEQQDTLNYIISINKHNKMSE